MQPAGRYRGTAADSGRPRRLLVPKILPDPDAPKAPALPPAILPHLRSRLAEPRSDERINSREGEPSDLSLFRYPRQTPRHVGSITGGSRDEILHVFRKQWYGILACPERQLRRCGCRNTSVPHWRMASVRMLNMRTEHPSTLRRRDARAVAAMSRRR
jgi:hypothetical protein